MEFEGLLRLKFIRLLLYGENLFCSLTLMLDMIFGHISSGTDLSPATLMTMSR